RVGGGGGRSRRGLRVADRNPTPEDTGCHGYQKDLAHRVPFLSKSMPTARRREEKTRRNAPKPSPRPAGGIRRWAGLLTSGSFYSRTFPPGQPHVSCDPPGQWQLRFRTRLQWRGPRRLFTGFPFQTASRRCLEASVTTPSTLSKKRRARGLTARGSTAGPEASSPAPGRAPGAP